MDVMELEIVVKSIDVRLSRIEQILPTLATKEDLKGFATKDDLKGFPTKDDPKGFATKDDLKVFATTVELREESAQTRAQFNAVAERIEGYVRLVAEGHTALQQRLDETNHRFERAIARLDHRVTRLEGQ